MVVLDPELGVEVGVTIAEIKKLLEVAEVAIVALLVEGESELCQTRRTPNPMLARGVSGWVGEGSRYVGSGIEELIISTRV